jgi:hypothetical protein
LVTASAFVAGLMMSDAVPLVLQPRRYDKALDRLSGHKRRAAVDVCALVIPLFGRVSKIATCAGVSGEMAFWTVKHGEHLI